MVLHGGSGAPDARAGSGILSQAQPGVLSLPARWKGNQPAGAGLNNLGNSCYLNSTLQCLAYIPPLGHLCLARVHSAACTRAPAPAPAASLASRPGAQPAAAPCTFCIIERQLAALLRGPRVSSVSPGEVVRNLHLFSRSFVKGRQEDSHELLTAVLDLMERDGRRAAVALGAPKGCRTIVEELFLGRWQSQVRCLVCGHESNTYESFATLPLDIGQARTVTEGLRAFTEAERLDGSNKYKCDRCRQLVPAVKQTTIWDDPNVLVMHLKRFDATSLLGKITRHVGFPETVDLHPYMTPPAARRRAEQQHQQEQQPQQQHAARNGHLEGPLHHHHRHGGDSSDLDHQPETHAHGLQDPSVTGSGSNHHHHSHKHVDRHGRGAHHHHHHHQQQQDSQPPAAAAATVDADGGGGRSTYSLTGVLVHQGTSLHSGHYYAFVRDSNDGWSCMNDSQVYGSSLEQVRQEQAYLLFYTRQSMKLPRPQPAAAEGGQPAPLVAAAGAAGTATRQVYGPQLPPHMTRGSANGSAQPDSGDAALPLRTARPTPAATPTARLPAKITVSPRPAAVTVARVRPATVAAASTTAKAKARVDSASTKAAGAENGKPATAAATEAAGGPATPDAVPEPVAGAAKTPASGRADGAAAEARKRKRASASLGDGGAAGIEQLRAAVQEEVAAHKACASWGEGAKRLRSSLAGMLRESDWMVQLRALVRAMQQSGLTLQEVLASGRADVRRRGLNRAMPPGVLRYGSEELNKMLRSLLSLAWLGGPVPVMLL